jgi:DNA-binding SARP family transcriptional activator
MQVRLLGSVEVVRHGVARPVAGSRRQALLAVLAVHCGAVVDAARLIDVVWGRAPPAGNTLQSHLSHLRRKFGVPVVARAPGYLLDLASEGTDVLVAERLIRQGQQTTDLTGRVQHLRAALALWRGRPLAGLADLVWAEEQIRRLDQLWLQAKQSLVEAQLALGQHAQLVAELQQLVQEHPYDERLHGQLMLALYRSGRQADALAVYDRLRRALSDGLGIDPGQVLRDQHAGMLRQDPSLQTPVAPAVATASAAVRAVVTPPAQLPPAVPAFAGRHAELASLDAILPTARTGPDENAAAGSAAVVISAVSGTAGVGKTALAVHWAHRVAGRFPDGQLYVNLRGFDPGGAALDPAEVIRRFLQALGVPADRLPPDLDTQIGLYRSELAGKRVLIVLDNARDAAQVRPLLPGAAGCLAVVTSRDRLTPLVAAEGAHPLTVDLLTTAEARDLLVHRLGTGRVAAEPDAVDEIITRCARLPLALAIAAARAATYPDLPLTRLVTEFADATGGLDALHGGDPGSDVRAVFSWSCRTVSAGAAGLFRQLGLHPGPDLTAPAAVSLAGIPGHQVRALLAELTRANLLTEHTPGRYTFHDLLRAWATEKAATHDNDDTRHAALHRVLDHYVHTAHTATLLLNPARDPIDLAPPQPGVTPEHLNSHDDGLAWFTAEQPVLLGAVELAAGAGLDAHTWQLAWALSTFLLRRGLWAEQVTLQRTALAAARRLGDAVGQAHTLRSLATAYVRLGRLDDAETYNRRAQQVYAALGDLSGQAHAYIGLVTVAEQRGDLAGALSLAQQALDLYRDGRDQVGQANTLNAIGWFHTRLGDHRQALAYCRRALQLLREVGYRQAEADTWDSLGHAYRALADYEQAASCYQHAVDLYRDLGGRYGEADALANLGDTHHAAGDPDTARKAWHQALAILVDLGHPDADKIHTRLDTTPDPQAKAPPSGITASSGPGRQVWSNGAMR